MIKCNGVFRPEYSFCVLTFWGYSALILISKVTRGGIKSESLV